MQNDKIFYTYVQKIEIVRYVCIFAYPKMWHLAPETHYKNLKTDQEKLFSGTSKKLRESPPKITFLIHT